MSWTFCNYAFYHHFSCVFKDWFFMLIALFILDSSSRLLLIWKWSSIKSFQWLEIHVINVFSAVVGRNLCFLSVQNLEIPLLVCLHFLYLPLQNREP